ncbi:hypothetical protein VC83_05074 [Pseudogymnoascus destructans]|uniref:Peptidase A2 domain-containing protein n=1 Tax=Pseudogymnoascus destructans TaxID=655981 RepID=A0A177AAQ8_9PEZI|nr:uncharacterized protein VC83_05074 [Pseudogymnoascus destructans]OAF58492.1 hypothetical protein VC83_05074 [Pseudogymnoascus destructans]
MDIVFGGRGDGCGDPRCEACSGGGMGGFMPPFPFPGFGMPPPFMPCGHGCTGDCQNPGGGFPGPMPGGMNFPEFPPPSGPGPSNFPGSGGQNFPGPYPQPTEWPGVGPGNLGGPSGGGGVAVSESPYVYPLGASGQRINLLIDTGASLTLISTAAYNKHFRGIPVMGGLLDQVATPDMVLTDPNLATIMAPLVARFPQGFQWPRHGGPHQVSCPTGLALRLKCGHFQTESLMTSATKTAMIESSASSSEDLLLVTVQAMA